jgi:hypothetical protein
LTPTSEETAFIATQRNVRIPSMEALRDELLNETLFTSLAQVRAVLNAWKDDTTMLGRTARSAI